MPSSKVIGVRVDSGIAERLEELARRRGKKVSDLLKELVESYLESAPQDNATISNDTIENALKQFNDIAMEYVENFKKFCKEHSEIVAQNHSNVDKEFIYEHCLWGFRRHVYNTLRHYYERKVIPTIRVFIRDNDTQLYVERRVSEIINKAVKELYSSPYPPVKTP